MLQRLFHPALFQMEDAQVAEDEALKGAVADLAVDREGVVEVSQRPVHPALFQVQAAHVAEDNAFEAPAADLAVNREGFLIASQRLVHPAGSPESQSHD